MATLEKAKLMNVDTNDSWDVLFNPKEYSVQKSVQWEPHKAPGLDTPEHEFTSGNPAVLNVELFFDTYEEKKQRNSPDHTKRRTLKTGETLALIAHEEYDDPAEWRRIADANGIVDPRDVKPGTVLTLPPIL